MNLVQIVPRFEPGSEGVSAFALSLAQTLELAGARTTRFIAGSDLAEGTVAARALDFEVLAGCDLVVLHYVGYGFHRRGVPWKLARTWSRLRRSSTSDGPRLGVVFHEVAAFGPPWRSSFWLRPLQRRIARRVLRASDAAATSIDRYRDLLRSLDSTKSVAVIGIPSTIGEPERIPEFGAREDRLVVFGSSGVRARAWGRYRADIALAARALGAREIADVGADVGAPEMLEGLRVVRTGVVEASTISDLLARSRGGFLAYPPDFLGKSTVFAAYAAHGVAPVCAWTGRQARSPRAEEPWTSPARDLDAAAVAARARVHYRSRSLARHAEVWLRLLEQQ